MSALAIDPFDSDHAAYATGATIYASHDLSQAGSDHTTQWNVWAEGIEETAIITLLSPADGAHLLSGFGDIGGFAHDDLTVSPPAGMYTNPRFSNTDTLDCAGQRPLVVVRSGRADERSATLAYSEDGGRTWQPLDAPLPATQPAAGARRRSGVHGLAVSADGGTFVLASAAPMLTRDRGKTWQAVKGLPPDGAPVADRVNPAVFYALDTTLGAIFASTDGGQTFTRLGTQGLPNQPIGQRGSGAQLLATPGRAHDLWVVSDGELRHSTDGGKSFDSIKGDVAVDVLGFGKAPPGRDEPALFAIGKAGSLRAIWRSDDGGHSWLRVNDDQHQYGTRFRCISGDPRVFGRVYVGTDGRGIVYGDPAAPATTPPSKQ